RPDIPALLGQAHASGCGIDLDDVTYYIGHETVIRRDDGRGMSAFQGRLFAAMERNCAHVTDYFRIPPESVVEIGRQIGI
ncbi:KUP/HAK/KT family potassium transporter, partial [Escherichia coli]|uniref:KUP/HAK/KT family potassium transporter n=1 Tax=Escherichia coli TaxID=562 RepID=UPI003EB8D021